MKRRRVSFQLIVSLTITFYSSQYIASPFSFIQNYEKSWYTKTFLASVQEPLDFVSTFESSASWFLRHEKISNILVCGDGDLSYSASIATHCSNLGISLTASVLEDEATHNRVYVDSLQNSASIRKSSPQHSVLFGIDATQLPMHFPNEVFDRIVFNFPHWKGKSNHKHNKALLNAFFESAVHLLSTKGEIHVSLCQHQGGNHAKTIEEWKDSWAISVYAAEHGLLNIGINKFLPNYTLSSFRGRDKGFYTGDQPDLYIFSKPNGVDSVPKQLRLCCRQELHVQLPDRNSQDLSSFILEDIKWGDSILNMARSVVPQEISVEVPARKIWSQEETGYPTDIAIFLVVYCGEGLPMRRGDANEYRSRLESKVSEVLALRENRKDRFVSKPFPYSLLSYILKVHSSYGHMKDSYHEQLNEKETIN